MHINCDAAFDCYIHEHARNAIFDTNCQFDGHTNRHRDARTDGHDIYSGFRHTTPVRYTVVRHRDSAGSDSYTAQCDEHACEHGHARRWERFVDPDTRDHRGVTPATDRPG